jgi:tRNA (guanosine-2'-O-)-methyltransferase
MAATWGAVVATLERHLAPTRLARLRAVLSRRLADTALLFENITDAHNVAACFRTADALGIQHIHLVETYASAFTSHAGVDKGTGKWLSLQRHGHVSDAVAALRAGGFRLLVTDLGPGAVPLAVAVQQSLQLAPHAPGRAADPPLAPLPPRPRVALCFGNEHRGASRLLRDAADVRFHIPQRGFAQSLNISVAAAIAARAFVTRTRDYDADDLPAPRERASDPAPSGGAPAPPHGPLGCEYLSPDAQAATLARWLLATVNNAEVILERAGLRPPDL